MANVRELLERISSEDYSIRVSIASSVESFVTIVDRSVEATELKMCIHSDVSTLDHVHSYCLELLSNTETRNRVLFPDYSVAAILCIIRDFLSTKVDELFKSARETDDPEFMWASLLVQRLERKSAKNDTYEIEEIGDRSIMLQPIALSWAEGTTPDFFEGGIYGKA